MGFRKFLCFVWILTVVGGVSSAQSQDKIKIAYSSTDTLNQLWTIPQEVGFYKKNGLDVELVYIGSTTVGIAAIVAQDIQIGNAAGSGVANANVRGGDTVSVGCLINVLAYELVVLDSIKTPEDLRGKSIGISRFSRFSASIAAISPPCCARALATLSPVWPMKWPISRSRNTAARMSSLRLSRMPALPPPVGQAITAAAWLSVPLWVRTTG